MTRQHRHPRCRILFVCSIVHLSPTLSCTRRGGVGLFAVKAAQVRRFRLLSCQTMCSRKLHLVDLPSADWVAFLGSEAKWMGNFVQSSTDGRDSQQVL